MLRLTIKKVLLTTVEISEVQGQPLPLFAGAEPYTVKPSEFKGNIETNGPDRDREKDKRQVLLALKGYQQFRALPAERALILSV